MIQRLSSLSIAIASAALSLAIASGATAKTAEEIEACVKANLPPETSVQTITLKTHNRMDEITSAEVKLYWKRLDEDHSNVMMRFEAPLDRRGSALLMLQKQDTTDMFMYLPELDRTRRVTGRMLEGSMFGTDFTYEQFQRLQGLAEDVLVERLDDVDMDGATHFVLEHTPRPVKGARKERVVNYIDPEKCIQMRTEFFDGEGDPRKVLLVDSGSIEHDSGLWIPRKVTMKDMRDGTETDLHIEKLEIGVDIPRKTFNQSSLSRTR
jgi:hypothetical protein